MSGNTISIDNISIIVTGSQLIGVGNLSTGTVTPAGGTVTAISMQQAACGNIGSFTVASLPAASGYNLGTHAFASNGRNTGEGAGNGTGTPVFVKNITSVHTWCAIWSGVAVTS